MKRYLILFLALVLVGCLLFLGIYSNTEHRYDYNEIPGGVQMIYHEDTDSYQMAYFFPKTSKLHGEQYEVLYTDADGVEHWRMYYYLSAMPWQVREQSEYTLSGWAHYHANGQLYGSYGDVTVRVVEIYYLNSDGTTVLLWERGY